MKLKDINKLEQIISDIKKVFNDRSLISKEYKLKSIDDSAKDKIMKLKDLFISASNSIINGFDSIDFDATDKMKAQVSSSLRDKIILGKSNQGSHKKEAIS